MTQRVALLGTPLKRRHSPVMHDAAFAAAGIDARYELMELDEDAVPDAVEAARGEGWLGLGVTAPYKRLVAELVDVVEPDAALIGAVNNVVRTEDGRLIGFNSDAPGFRVGVELAMGRPLAGIEVVVAGAGGAANAVVFACVQAGARRVSRLGFFMSVSRWLRALRRQRWRRPSSFSPRCEAARGPLM